MYHETKLLFLFYVIGIIGEDGKPVTMMSVTLSFDEEAIPSVSAATFMSTLRSLLETPQSMLLGHVSFSV